MLAKLFTAGALALTLSTNAFAAEHEVKLLTADAAGQTMIMEPGYLKIAKGDTIKFTPADPTHNVESMVIPEGAEAFNGPMGQPFSVTFNNEGVYLYKCTPHFVMGMLGVIQVDNAVNIDDVKQQWTTIEPGVMMNKERIAQYLEQAQ
ncbi:pseudoazurin [Shewanella maritima]|uniref:Pseudoazurin n=1 Tax=Shewanella maritima TaxID=2520507 RepID=A0A411PI32_9GAMM|nr:pseudoazurin [Shewanella maritima]QBF83277.1 pseudoazurin [Shewanella maritima]